MTEGKSELHVWIPRDVFIEQEQYMVNEFRRTSTKLTKADATARAIHLLNVNANLCTALRDEKRWRDLDELLTRHQEADDAFTLFCLVFPEFEQVCGEVTNG